jgi:hypothetical protein
MTENQELELKFTDYLLDLTANLLCTADILGRYLHETGKEGHVYELHQSIKCATISTIRELQCRAPKHKNSSKQRIITETLNELEKRWG